MKHVAIEGNVASGKTTLLKGLHNIYKIHGVPCITYPEPIEEWQSFSTVKVNMLRKMYDDPRKNCYDFQVMALITKCEQLSLMNTETVTIVERSILAQEKVFIPILRDNYFISPLEYELLMRMKNLLLEKPQLRPDVIVYLKCDPITSFQRLTSRGRSEEKSVTVDYLRALHDKYESWLTQSSNVIIIDANDATNIDCFAIYNEITKYVA